MIWRTRFSSLAVSTRPQNETVSSKCPDPQQWRHDSGVARSRVEHLGAKVQRNPTHQLYGANGQSPGASFARLDRMTFGPQVDNLPHKKLLDLNQALGLFHLGRGEVLVVA